MPRTNELTLLPKLPLLITESADEFDALRDAFEQEIKPRGIIEQMYVQDISAIVWEILRLRRCKVVIINAAFRDALEYRLVRLRQPGQKDFEARDGARRLAHAWFTDKGARERVSETLSRFDLDESAIEAQAIRRSSSDLELLERMLACTRFRRHRVRCFDGAGGGSWKDGSSREEMNFGRTSQNHQSFQWPCKNSDRSFPFAKRRVD